LKQDLDKLAREDSGFRVHYVLNNPPAGWTGGVGFVTADMIKVSFEWNFGFKCDGLTVYHRNFSPLLQLMSRSSFAARLLWSLP
jgi:hypothetical protein